MDSLATTDKLGPIRVAELTVVFQTGQRYDQSINQIGRSVKALGRPMIDPLRHHWCVAKSTC